MRVILYLNYDNQFVDDGFSAISLSARFNTVQYGEYKGQPACLLVMTFNFHASNPRQQRFRNASITLKCASLTPKIKATQPRILAFAPHSSFGALSTSKVTSNHEFSAQLSLGYGPASLSASPTFSRSEDAIHGHRVVILGTERGSPPSRIVWSITENPHHPDGILGIPSTVRTAAVIGMMDNQERFAAIFEVDASVGFTLNPRRWALKLVDRDDAVLFDRRKPLKRDYEDLGPVFDKVDLEALSHWVQPP